MKPHILLSSARRFGFAKYPLAVAMGCLMIASGLHAQVINGNFEDNSNGGLGTGAWVLEDPAVFNNAGFGSSAPPLASQDAGTRLMTLQNGNNGGRISQDVLTNPGTYYELSFWHNNLDNRGVQGSGVQSITWSVGDIGSEIIAPTSFAYPDHVGGNDITHGWTQETETFQALDMMTRIAFEGTPDSSGGFWGIQLDNVSLLETAPPPGGGGGGGGVPEPSSLLLWGLLAVGGALFGWRRRFRMR